MCIVKRFISVKFSDDFLGKPKLKSVARESKGKEHTDREIMHGTRGFRYDPVASPKNLFERGIRCLTKNLYEIDLDFRICSLDSDS